MTSREEPSAHDEVGAVIIGRNEGERLRHCLESVVGRVAAAVYVDSGSTDGSVELAEGLGATVVLLDQEVPFTAGRARNAGFERLIEVAPDISFVQFIDGDCVVFADWWQTGIDLLRSDESIAVVNGRQQEMNRDSTIYNLMMDIEWDSPTGKVKSCPGCAMYRASVFRNVGGFNPTVIAGEEPELCVRIRAAGSSVVCVADPMARHEGSITKFTQWWMRNVRAGHAYAQGRSMHGSPPERHWVRESRSIWFWGLCLPALAIAFAVPTQGWSLLLFAGYLWLIARIWFHTRRRGYGLYASGVYTFFTTLGKWPQLYGQVKFFWRKFRNRGLTIIEYKSS